MRFYSAKADENQPEIVKELRRLGGKVAHVHRLKNHCDLNLFYRGVTVMVEVKMPGGSLTEGEDVFRQMVESEGCKYAVLKTINEARCLIQSIYEHTPEYKA
tara:strand:+ start:636 stop:941 length:306 start_codon:yes stop_codon:yes gene_type:complete